MFIVRSLPPQGSYSYFKPYNHSLELGTWNLELGTWNLELGTWNKYFNLDYSKTERAAAQCKVFKITRNVMLLYQIFYYF